MRSLVEAHDRIKDFEWEPSYAVKQDRYPTKYKIPAKTKDPFRHLIRDYVAMEQEKTIANTGPWRMRWPDPALRPRPTPAGWRS